MLYTEAQSVQEFSFNTYCDCEAENAKEENPEK